MPPDGTTRYVTTPTLRLTGLLAGLVLLTGAGEAAARFKDLTPVADAQVASGTPAVNAGAATSFYIQSADPSNSFGNERAWLRFDISEQIPPDAVISSARLRIYAFQADTQDDLVVDVHGSSNDAWDESVITWASQPGFGPALTSGTLASQQPFLWYEFDVTAFVQAEALADGVVTLVVKPQVEGSAQWQSYRFNAREFIRDGYSFVPRLRIEFNGNWPVAGSINVIHTNDLHSRLTSHDMDFPDLPGEAPALEAAGGAAILGSTVVARKKARPDSLVLDAGDISEGNPLGDLRGNGGTVDYFQTLDALLKGLSNNADGRGVDGVVVGNHDVRELAMLENMMDPDGDGVMNGWVDTNADGVVDTFNPPGTDPDDVPYLAVNVVRDGQPKPAPGAWPQSMPFRPYNVVMVNGQRVAVLGYITDDSAILTAETVNEIDVLEAAWTDKDNGVPTTNVVLLEEWVAHLRKPQAQGGEGADVVILLSHIGHRRLNSDGNVGFGDGNDELLGDQGDTAPPDLVVSGHWHTWTATAWQPQTLNYKTTNVEAASYGQYVGEVTLSASGRYLDSAKHAIRVSTFQVPNPDPEVDAAYNTIATLLGGLETEYESLTGPDCVIDAATVQVQVPGYVDGRPCPLDYVVGHSAVDLTLDKDKWFTLSEFPWSGDNTAGEWIADAMVSRVRSLNINGGVTGAANAHLAIQSGGGIRRDIAAGPVTYREIFEAYPWDDDSMVRVQMTSQQIWNYIEGRFVGSSISEDWQVSAEDGVVTAIVYDSDQDGVYDTPLAQGDTTTVWNVIISEFMYENDSWISETGGTNDTFQGIDPNPEYIGADGSTSPTPITAGAGPAKIRDSVVEYTATFQAGNPMQVRVPRYLLNTEIAGEFDAVVTMTADADAQPYFEGIFVRLLAPTAETLARRNLPGDPYGLTSLVNADGSINTAHEFAETMLYRSHLGFPDGYLRAGDILRIRGEFGFFDGNAQFVDQEGIVGPEQEFDIIGHDPALALPNYFNRTADFMVEAEENHLVKFYAVRTGDNSVEDAAGTALTTYREGGFFSSVVLPGSNGDCLELIGVSTERASDSISRRFRLREATADPLGGACFPPTSMVLDPGGPLQAGIPVTINAMAEDLNGFSAAGAGWFAAMDIDGEGATLPVTLTVSGIDISGRTGLGLRVALAEDLASDSNDDWDAADFVHIDYRIDGGAYQNLLQIENDGSTFNGAARVDTDFDGVGDGATLTDVFTTFTAAIAGLGNTLDIRVTFRLDAGDEDIGLDDLQVVDGSGQSLFLEDFEDATVGYTTSIPEFSDGSGDFFTRTDGSNIGGFVAYQGLPGGTQQFGTVTSVEFFVSTDNGLNFVSIGVDSDGSDGFSVQYTPPVSGDLAFYSIATDNDGLVEMFPIVPDQFLFVGEPPPASKDVRRVPALPGLMNLLALLVLVVPATLAARRRRA